MPSYGSGTAKLTGVLRPTLFAGPFVPNRVFPFSGTPTFGVAASQAIYADQATSDGATPLADIVDIDLFYLTPNVPNPVEFLSIGSESLTPNLLGFPFFTQWNGFMALASFNLSLPALGFWIWKGGNARVVTGSVPGFYTGPNLNGTPIKWQGTDYFVHALDTNTHTGGAVLISEHAVTNATIWPGMDTTHTTNAPPTYPDEGDGFNYFFQDGLPLPSKRPSIVKVSSTTGVAASYTSITLDNLGWDAELRSIIAGPNYALAIVPNGFLFTGQGLFILLAKDGSTYTVYEPIPGDATAIDLFGLNIDPIGTGGNVWNTFIIQALPDRNGNFWMVSQQGNIDGETVVGQLVEPPSIPHVVTFGCWPCLPVANGTR